jgi:hypothetical protein
MDWCVFTVGATLTVQLIQWFIYLWVRAFRHLTHGSTCHWDSTYIFTCCNSSNQLKLRHFRSCWHCEQAQRHYNKNTNSKWNEVSSISGADVGMPWIPSDVSHQRPSTLAQCSGCLSGPIILVNLCAYAQLTCPSVCTYTCLLSIRFRLILLRMSHMWISETYFGF